MQHPGHSPVGCKVFHKGRDGRPLSVELRYTGMPYRVTVKYNPTTGKTRVYGLPGCDRVPREELIKFVFDAAAAAYKL